MQSHIPNCKGYRLWNQFAPRSRGWRTGRFRKPRPGRLIHLGLSPQPWRWPNAYVQHAAVHDPERVSVCAGGARAGGEFGFDYAGRSVPVASVFGRRRSRDSVSVEVHVLIIRRAANNIGAGPVADGGVSPLGVRGVIQRGGCGSIAVTRLRGACGDFLDASLAVRATAETVEGWPRYRRNSRHLSGKSWFGRAIKSGLEGFQGERPLAGNYETPLESAGVRAPATNWQGRL